MNKLGRALFTGYDVTSCIELMAYYGFIFTLDTGLLHQDRKRPRKLSHKVLDCTIEEVSAAPTKKRVCLGFLMAKLTSVKFFVCFFFWIMFNTFRNLFVFQELKRHSGITSEVKVLIRKTQVR